MRHASCGAGVAVCASVSLMRMRDEWDLQIDVRGGALPSLSSQLGGGPGGYVRAIYFANRICTWLLLWYIPKLVVRFWGSRDVRYKEGLTHTWGSVTVRASARRGLRPARAGRVRAEKITYLLNRETSELRDPRGVRRRAPRLPLRCPRLSQVARHPRQGQLRARTKYYNS